MSEAPERIWIEDPQEMVPYFYEESELHEVAAPVSEYIRADLVEAAVKRALEGAATAVEELGYFGPSESGLTVAWEIRALNPAKFIDGEK